MKIIIEIDTDRIPVQSVEGRERFDRDMLAGVSSVIDAYGAHVAVSPSTYTVKMDQVDDA